LRSYGKSPHIGYAGTSKTRCSEFGKVILRGFVTAAAQADGAPKVRAGAKCLLPWAQIQSCFHLSKLMPTKKFAWTGGELLITAAEWLIRRV
jgi:hypothetical protein